jgi:hypothetical protein
MQSQLWERLIVWIRKHLEDKIVLLGDLNCTMPEVLATREIVWMDIGRHRPRGRTEYSNAALRALLLPGGLVWKVAHRRSTRYDPIPQGALLTEVITRKYGHLREGLTVVLTAEEWRHANIPVLRFEDSLSIGDWLLVPPERQLHTITLDNWTSLFPKLGFRWEITAVKPAQGQEVRHDGLRALLLDSFDLYEQTLDALDGLSLQPDSFVSLASDGLCVRPAPLAPPPHYCYIQVRDHFFVPCFTTLYFPLTTMVFFGGWV